jgi:hypothetical protein
MPFGPSTTRNSREEYVLQKIEYYKVMEYMGRSDWKRHYFKSYKDAVKSFKKLKESKRKVLIFACRNNELGELSTGINDRFKDE